MRLITVLIAFLFIAAACNGVADDDVDEVPDPTPTPDEVADDEPEPTPTATPVEGEDDIVQEEEPTPAPDDDAEEVSADMQEQIDEVAENVSELRGLEILEDIDANFLTQDEFEEYLLEETEIEQVEIDLDWLFRLIPDRDEDIEQLLIEMQVHGVAGFYDVEEEQLFVIMNGDELSASAEITLAHEIVHALQDQHFGLDGIADPDHDYDAGMALRSIIEGDAVLTEEMYATEYFSEERQQEYQQESMELAQDEEAMAAIMALPDYYLEWFLFPYSAGENFMMRVFEDDFSAIDEHLENPPVSTYQLLNVDAYLAGDIDDPVDVELPDIEGRIGDDWEQEEYGTVGVFTLFMMLHLNGAMAPETVMNGWAGDYFEFYTGEDDHVFGAIGTVWESEEGAGAFEDELVSTFAEYDEEDGVWTDGERYHTVIADGDSVQLMSSTDPDALLDAAEIE